MAKGSRRWSGSSRPRGCCGRKKAPKAKGLRGVASAPFRVGGAKLYYSFLFLGVGYALVVANAGGRGLVHHRDVARNLRAFLDLDLGVADLARHLARGLDHELLAHRDLAFEAAADLGLVDGDRALEHAVLGDFQNARVQRGVNTAFDHKRVAVADLDAFQLDVRTDHELGLLALVGLSLHFK